MTNCSIKLVGRHKSCERNDAVVCIWTGNLRSGDQCFNHRSITETHDTHCHSVVVFIGIIYSKQTKYWSGNEINCEFHIEDVILLQLRPTRAIVHNSLKTIGRQLNSAACKSQYTAVDWWTLSKEFRSVIRKWNVGILRSFYWKSSSKKRWPSPPQINDC